MTVQHRMKIQLLNSIINFLKQPKVALFSLLILFSYSFTFGQLSITTTATPFTIDFDNTVSGVNNGQFNGSGFSPSPATGQINSNAFAITGLSDGTLNFGGTQTSGDFARGASTGNVPLGTGGIYAFNHGGLNYSLGYQPTTDDMTPGTFTLRIQNNTGADATSILVDYNIWYRNDQARSTSIDGAYSSDGITFYSVSSVHFQTPSTADALGWQSTSRTFAVDLSSTPLANGDYFYIRWNTDDVVNPGIGSRDELALDDISVIINPPSDNDSDIQDFGEQPATLSIPSTIDTQGEVVEVLYFMIQDKATADFLPTNVKSIRIIPGPGNSAVWSTQIGGVQLYDGGNIYPTLAVDITDTHIDMTFADGVLTIPTGSTMAYGLLLYLKSNGITDGANLQFEISSDPTGFESYLSGSGFASSFPAPILSNILPITVTASELRFQNQPVNANTFQTMPTDVSAEATDENGNRDLDFISNVSLSSTGTMTGDPITVASVSGLATWSQSVNPIIHTIGGTNLTLSASSSGLISGISDPFDITQTANQLNFTYTPDQGQRNQIVATIIVSALA